MSGDTGPAVGRSGHSAWFWGLVSAVLVGLITSGTAPWWWSSLTGPEGDSDAPATITTQGSSTREPASRPTRSRTAAAISGCAIQTTSVTRLYDEADVRATSVTMEGGEYAVLDQRDVEYAGSSNRWYLVKIGGDEGWVVDFPGQVVGRSDDCS